MLKTFYKNNSELYPKTINNLFPKMNRRRYCTQTRSDKIDFSAKFKECGKDRKCGPVTRKLGLIVLALSLLYSLNHLIAEKKYLNSTAMFVLKCFSKTLNVVLGSAVGHDYIFLALLF